MMTTSVPKVGIVILNWNNAPDTLACLASVARLTYANRFTIVVDNGSTDDSVSLIRRRYSNIDIINAGENLGYTGGNNLGMRRALDQHADYVWLLNDDVTVSADSLEILLYAAENETRAGILSPLVCLRDEPQKILTAGGKIEYGWNPVMVGLGEPDRGQFAPVSEVDFVSGCALLASRQLVETIGPLDDAFFSYYEDVDWCMRARKAGFKVLAVSRAKVWHPDTRIRDLSSPLVTYYTSRNSLLIARKQRLGSRVLLNQLSCYSRRLASWSLRPRWKHKRRQRDALLRALVDFARGRYGQAPETI